MTHSTMGLRAVLRAGVLALLTTLCVAAPSAAFEAEDFEVEEYQRTFDVSESVAERNLGLQRKGGQTDIVGDLESRLDDDFGGIWFEPESGDYVVSIVSPDARTAVGEEMATARLAANFRTRQARYSWKELERAQDAVDTQLQSFLKAGLVYTSLDPQGNAAVIHVAAGADKADRSALARIARAVGDEVELRQSEEDRFRGYRNVCAEKHQNFTSCDPPLRSGVEIGPVGSAVGSCTMGFRAIGKSNGDRYVLTTGHCSGDQWQAWEGSGYPPNRPSHYLGAVEQRAFGNGHDWMKINATGSWWDEGSSWPSMVAYWGESTAWPPIDLDYSITAESKSFVGQGVCLSGSASGGSCGQVIETNLTYALAGISGEDFVKVKGGCSKGGDSGGPQFEAHVAYGLHVGSSGTLEECHPEKFSYYHEITDVADDLNVTVAPRRPDVTLHTASGLNGNTGWATVKGNAYSNVSLNGKTINVHFAKWNGSQWVYNRTLTTTLSGNDFAIENAPDFGTGTWRATAEFPFQAPLPGELSSPLSFEIRDGYRLVSKHSGKCLDVAGVSTLNGAGIQQWDCYDPVVQQNQVFTLVPEGNSNYRIVARHSGRCVSVKGAGSSNGTLLEQWDCIGPGQPGQSWKGVPVSGEWINLRANHSNKCMDVLGWSQSNGGTVGQWDCGSAYGNQLWSLKSVNSGPIPTSTHITIPPGETLNGQPGYVTVQGHVKSGAYGLGGHTVKVSYEKETSPGNWTYQFAHNPTLNSEGFYQRRYEGVSTGKWRAWTWFPGVGNLAGSSSPHHYFEIRSGYRLVARHSGKCMSLSGNNGSNGTPVIQWDCSPNPWPGDGQVFTIVPLASGYFWIKVNSSGKCLDVAAASTGNGAAINNWDCGGGHNQQWGVVPIQGQEPWVAFQVRHSGKCADVYFSGQANGTSILQWDCHWGGNQQWQFKPVG